MFYKNHLLASQINQIREKYFVTQSWYPFAVLFNSHHTRDYYIRLKFANGMQFVAFES